MDIRVGDWIIEKEPVEVEVEGKSFAVKIPYIVTSVEGDRVIGEIPKHNIKNHVINLKGANFIDREISDRG